MSNTSQPFTGDPGAWIESAAEALRQAEESNRKAKIEAESVCESKTKAEEYLRIIFTLKDKAESDANWLTTAKQSIDQANTDITQLRADAEISKKALEDALNAIEQARSAAKGDAEQAETFRAQLEKTAADAATHLKSSQGSSSNAGAAREAATKALEEIERLFDHAKNVATAVDEQASNASKLAISVTEAHNQVSEYVKSMKSTDERAAHTLSVIINHENDLSELKTKFKLIHDRIESLLPSATSAGLASAFREQKSRFFMPQWMWLCTFILTIGGLLASSLWGLPTAGDSWDSMGRHFVNRLPLIGPLVWLAIYAGRHYGLALRLQEEYAYKEAVSAAFEGYKREMATVEQASDGRSPLVTLCENVLRTLGQRPGRIYEGKHEDITPASTITGAAKEIVETAKGMMKADTGKADT